MKEFMQQALAQAKIALDLGEFPIGAVITYKGAVIAAAHNMVESQKNPTLHAEIVCINQALDELGEKYLNDCEMYVTLEPCIMCYKAISLTKLKRLYIGAMNTEDLYSVERLDPKSLDLNHIPEIVTEVMADQAKKLFDVHLKRLRNV